MSSKHFLSLIRARWRNPLRLGRAVAALHVAPSHHSQWIRRAAIGCLLVFVIQPALFAQASAGRGDLQFRTMGWGVAPDDLFYSVAGRDVRVKIFDAGRSGFHSYPKKEEIAFYRIVKKEDGTEERIIVATGDLTDGGPTPLLILTKSKADPDQYNVAVIADDLSAFPEQTLRFVNFTAIDIEVTVGPKAATIPAGAIRLVETNLEKDKNTSYVTLFVTVSDKKLMLSYNNWVFRPGQRVMVFISVGQDGRPKVIRLIDAVASLR